MKKARLLLVLLLTAFTLFGCQAGADGSSTFSPEQSSIFVSRDLNISSALVASHNNSERYDQEELTQDIEQFISEYNNQYADGRIPVSLRSCSLTSETATVMFDYLSEQDLVDFSGYSDDDSNQLVQFNTSVLPGEIPADLNFISTKDQTKATISDINGQKDLKAVFTEGTAVIQTEGRILYISDGVNLLDEFTVATPEGNACIVFK